MIELIFKVPNGKIADFDDAWVDRIAHEWG